MAEQRAQKSQEILDFDTSLNLNDDLRCAVSPEDLSCHPKKQIPSVILFPSLSCPIVLDANDHPIKIFTATNLQASPSIRFTDLDQTNREVKHG